MTAEILGSAIRRARKERGLSQEALAEMADITPTHMKHIESGHRGPSLPVLFRLARALPLSLDNLIFGGERQEEAYREAALLLRERSEGELRILIATMQAMREEACKE